MPAIHTSNGPTKSSTVVHVASETTAAYLSGGRSRRTAAAIDSTYVAMNDDVENGNRSGIPQPAAYAAAAATAQRAPKTASAPCVRR